MKASILVVICAAVLFAGCTFSSGKTVTGTLNDSISDVAAKTKCIQLCNIKLISSMDIRKGPCVSDEVVEDWVCDIVNNPRQAVDDDPANQCPAYGITAHHFVELDTGCKFVRSE